jgi:hypothetical protein
MNTAVSPKTRIKKGETHIMTAPSTVPSDIHKNHILSQVPLLWLATFVGFSLFYIALPGLIPTG